MLFSVYQIGVHRSLPVKKLGAALVGEDHDAINHQIGRAVVWNDLHCGITEGGVVGGKRGFDFFCILGLVVTEMLDQANLFPQAAQVIPLVLADKQFPSAPEHDGIIVMAPEFSPARASLHMIGRFTKQALQGSLQKPGLVHFFINHLFTSSSGIK